MISALYKHHEALSVSSKSADYSVFGNIMCREHSGAYLHQDSQLTLHLPLIYSAGNGSMELHYQKTGILE